MKGLVIVGRDGVINETVDGGIRSLKAWIPIPGSIEALAKLSEHGFTVVVATNQGGIGRNALDVETLHTIHEAMHQAVTEAGGRIDAIVFAPRVARRTATESKSKADLFEDLIDRYRAPTERVTVIGDAREDIEAAAESGLHSILVQTGRGQDTLQFLAKVDGVTVHRDLSAAAAMLIAQQG